MVSRRARVDAFDVVTGRNAAPRVGRVQGACPSAPIALSLTPPRHQGIGFMIQVGPAMGSLWTLWMAITSAMFHTSRSMANVSVLCVVVGHNFTHMQTR